MRCYKISMRRRLVWGLLVLLLSTSSAPARKHSRILILPVNSQTAPGLVLPVLLGEYLSLSEKFSILPIPEESLPAWDLHKAREKGQEKGADFVVTVSILPGVGGHQLKLSLQPIQSDKTNPLDLGGNFVFPGTMNHLLLESVEKISEGAGSKISQKKLLPFLNVASSEDTYALYAKGALRLQDLTKDSLQKAAGLFEQAIQKDYNHVPSYLGLSESLAGLSALARSDGSNPQAGMEAVRQAQRARVELEKAKILNPLLAERKERRIERCLKATQKDLCPGGKK